MARRVLVVDDDPLILRALTGVLEREGMEVDTSKDGAECLQAISAHPPDLVILDVAMPVMDGFQALRALREKEETKHIPVIMLTARREDRDVLRGWMTGVDLYLTKPFGADDLLVAVRRLLDVIGSGAEPRKPVPDSPGGDASAGPGEGLSR